MEENRLSFPSEPTKRKIISLDVIGFILGPLVLLFWLFAVDSSTDGTGQAWLHLTLGLNEKAHIVAGVMLLTIIWWITEPIPIPATGLLAVALCVFLGGVPDEGRGAAAVAMAPFGNPSLYFLLGGMFIGRSMTRHGLDRRIAYTILATRWAGSSSSTLLMAVGITVGCVSLLVSNTAATAMVFPITMGIISVLASSLKDRAEEFTKSPYASMLLLMTAYASSITGVMTPIGTSTNIIAIGFFQQPSYSNASVDFIQWMKVGVPLSVSLLIVLFFWLRFQAPSAGIDLPATRKFLIEHKKLLPAWSRGETNTLIVLVFVVGMWFTPAFLSFLATEETQRWFSQHFPEEIVALMAPVLLLSIPTNWQKREFTLAPDDLLKVDWGTMLLFGAGLSLGNLMLKTGFADALGGAAFDALSSHDLWVITGLAILAGILLSELTSNTATVSTLFPVIWVLCAKAGVDPVPPLMGLTFGASFGSALPVSTPPNAIVYGSGLIPMRRMIFAGVGLDIVSAVAIWVVLRVAYGFGWTLFR